MSTGTFTISRDSLAKSRGWLGIVILLPFTIATLLSRPAVWAGTWADLDFDLLGWPVFLAGAAFRWWATLYIGGRKTARLASEGPYSICRNPLYVGSFLMGLSIAIFLKSLTFAFGFGIASAFYLVVTVPSEERRLRAALGEQYIQYCQRVPRFIPRLSLFKTQDTIEVSVRGLAAEGWRTARWIWIPVLCELVTHLRAEPWWPHLFQLP